MKFISSKKERKFICFIHFIGLDNISLGLSINWHCPNLEIHLPFCFIKIGWQCTYTWKDNVFKTYGWTYDT